MTRTFLLPTGALWLAILLVACPGRAADPATTASGGTSAPPVGAPPGEPANVGLSGVELDELEEGVSPKVERFTIPPWYQEEAGPVELQMLFPFYFHRERTGPGARTDLGVLPFYWRYRGVDESADVVFPLYGGFHGPGFDTDIVLQTWWNRSDHGYNFGFGPLVFAGRDTRDASSYQVVPPLFWHFAKGESDFWLVGPYYGAHDGDDYDLGLPPLFFAGRDRDETYLVVAPPLFWRFTDEIRYETLNVVPPFFYKTRETGWSLGMVPWLYLAQDEDWARTMVLPFYYGSRWGEGRSHYLLPLLSYYRHAPGLSQGGIGPLWHWYDFEGDWLRMATPLFWAFGNDRTDEKSFLVPPLFYTHGSPVTRDLMLGLLWWDFHDFHRERTQALMPLFAYNRSLYEDRWRMYLAPTFDFGATPDSWHFRLHPLFYAADGPTSNHLVLAPLFWHFEDTRDDDLVIAPLWWQFEDLEHDELARVAFPLWWQFDDQRRRTQDRVFFPLYWSFADDREQSRTTVLAPILWRDRDPQSTMTGVLNVVWHEGAIKKQDFWTFRFFPIVAFGHPPAEEGSYWSFLEGFVGWRRQGAKRELKLLWIPIDLSD